MTDTPETDLEDDLSVECNNPCYECPMVKASTGEHLTGDFVPAEFARRLERERDEARKEAAKWKSNRDQIIPELVRRREAKDRSREIIARIASKAKEEQS